MNNSRITKMRIVSLNNMRVFCKCGATLTVTGSPKGVRAAIKLWAQDHKGEGHAVMTLAEWRKQRAAQKKGERLAKAKTLRDVNRNERIIFEHSKMERLFN